MGLAETFATLVRSSPIFELVTPTSFALNLFRMIPPQPPNPKPSKLSLSSLNELNRIFYRHVSSRPDIFLTQTDLQGTFCIRFSIGAQRTEERHVHAAFDLFNEEAKKALEEWKEEEIELARL